MKIFKSNYSVFITTIKINEQSYNSLISSLFLLYYYDVFLMFSIAA